MQARWTLWEHDGRSQAGRRVAQWDGVLPFGWRVLMSGRPRTAPAGLMAQRRAGLARFNKLADLTRWVPEHTAHALRAAIEADAAALNGLGAHALLLSWTGGDGAPPGEIHRACVAAGRAVDSLRRDTLVGPQRFVNAMRAGRGVLEPLAGLRLDETFDAADAPVPIGLVLSAGLASDPRQSGS